MSINFENKENRIEYLNQKMDNLLSGINATYGQQLLDELIVRLTRTITDFNEEVEKIMGNLKDNSERKSQIIHDLMKDRDVKNTLTSKPKDESIDKDGQTDTNDDAPEMSEWEKRLEGLK